MRNIKLLVFLLLSINIYIHAQVPEVATPSANIPSVQSLKPSPEPVKPTASTTKIEKQLTPEEALKYEREQLFGEPVRDDKGKLLYVIENKSQNHVREQCSMLRVKGFKVRNDDPGRIRVAVWNSAENYGKEGLKPFRSSSFWAKEAPDGEMMFKICGLEIGKAYSFFGHFDKNNDGIVNRLFGIPTEPYIFSNKANQGKGPGLDREGLSPPKFENTLVTYTAPGQEILLAF